MPSVEIVCEFVGATTPDRPSEQDHVSVTSVLFQPLPLASGLWLTNLIPGFVLSMLM